VWTRAEAEALVLGAAAPQLRLLASREELLGVLVAARLQGKVRVNNTGLQRLHWTVTQNGWDHVGATLKKWARLATMSELELWAVHALAHLPAQQYP
jgi:hypothetical protein